MCSLLSMIDGLQPDPTVVDRWEWIISSKGRFTTISLYLEMVNHRSSSFPHKRNWIPGIPSKVSFFIRNTYLDKILTLNHLQSRDWNLANRCVLCLQEEESVDHLFVHYSMVNMVWSFFLSHLHVFWSFSFLLLVLWADLVDLWLGGDSCYHLGFSRQ